MSRYLPDWRPSNIITRPSAERVNDLQPQKQTVTVAGYNEIAPIVYGQAEVGGPILAGPFLLDNGLRLVYAIALSHGPIDHIIAGIVGSDRVEIDATPTAGGLARNVAGDGYNYACRFYNGNQTAPCPVIKAVATNYFDTFNGVAYVTITATGINAKPGGIHFDIRGKRVFDPRINQTVYSENPALHMRDFLAMDPFGLRRGMIGFEALADECDRTLDYGPKTRANCVIVSSMGEKGALDLLAMNAEALFGYEGGNVRVVPDAAVDPDSIVDIPIEQIRAGTIKLSSRSSENIPTSITLVFDTHDDDGMGGSPAYVSIEQSTASDPVVNSNVTLMGVRRREEAQRRATERLARLRTPGRMTMQMFDSGVYFNAGDVIRMPSYMGLNGQTFRLISTPEMVGAGVYSMAFEVYNAGNYLIPKGASELPAGSVTFRMDDTIPSGGQRLSDLGLISGSNTALTSTGGADFAMPRFNTSVAGGHSADKTIPGAYPLPNFNNSWGGRAQGEIRVEDGSHNHKGSSTGSVGVGLYERFNVRAVRFDGGASLVPIGTIFFSRDELESNAIYAKMIAKGLLSVANDDAGFREKFDFSLGMSGEHDHALGVVRHAATTGKSSGGSDGSIVFFKGVMHNHNPKLNGLIRQDLKKIALGSYLTTKTDSVIAIGGIIGFTGAGNVPSGWALCDGNNGTIDLRGSFIDIDGSDSNGVSDISDITLTGISLDDDGAHNHISGTSNTPRSTKYRRMFTNQPQLDFYHDMEKGIHNHDIIYPDGNPFPITIKPRYTKMRFIQYIGE